MTQTPSASALAQDIRALVGKLKRRLRELGQGGDLTPTQTAVLLHLERHGAAGASDLARAEAMRPQSMGTVVAGLEAAGLVVGAPDHSDGRRTLLSLTNACRRWIEEGRSARQDWLTRTIQARLTSDEQAQLHSALGLLNRLMED